VLRIRTFYGDTSEYRLTSLVFNPTTVRCLSDRHFLAAVTIDLANGDYTKRITPAPLVSSGSNLNDNLTPH